MTLLFLALLLAVSSAAQAEQLARFGIRNSGSSAAPVYSLAGGDPALASLDFLKNGTATATLKSPFDTKSIQVEMEGSASIISLRIDNRTLNFQVPKIVENGVAVIVINGSAAK